MKRTLCMIAVGWLVSLGPPAPYAAAQQIRATPVATFSDMPIGLEAPPGDGSRVFILERAGRVRVIRDGTLLTRAFLDIRGEVSTAGEGGLLGLAFHPGYRTNGRLFVSFIRSNQNDPVVREYRVSADPDVADSATAYDIVAGGPYGGNGHYACGIAFGPDGKLYFSLGDDNNHSLPQSLASRNGKILRLDVDRPPSYVPLDNPYPLPGDGGYDWLWARGFRNPYRFSFDRLKGDLYIADVGNGDREEIDFQKKSVGAPGAPGYQGSRNYGWPCMEGTFCPWSDQCTCDGTGATLDLPAQEYSHQGGSAAIIGGFVYRGSAILGMQGRYFYADFNMSRAWTLEIRNGAGTDVQEITSQLGLGNAGGIFLPTSFGEDANGELYFTTAIPSALYRIDPVVPVSTPTTTYCETARNSIGPGARIDSTGAPSIATPELVLIAEHAPSTVNGLFFHGGQQAQAPLGNGWRCIGGTLKRLPVIQTDANGMAVQPFAPASISAVPGQVRYFQFFYRDNAAGGAKVNLTEGLRVVFCP